MTNGTHPDQPTEDAITWRHSPTGQTYVLTADSYRCLVWQTMRTTWGGVVNSGRESTASYSFATPEEAKAWCEAQVRHER